MQTDTHLDWISQQIGDVAQHCGYVAFAYGVPLGVGELAFKAVPHTARLIASYTIPSITRLKAL